MEKIRYSEIFRSVQGEGRFVGVPSVFFFALNRLAKYKVANYNT